MWPAATSSHPPNRPMYAVSTSPAIGSAARVASIWQHEQRTRNMPQSQRKQHDRVKHRRSMPHETLMAAQLTSALTVSVSCVLHNSSSRLTHHVGPPVGPPPLLPTCLTAQRCSLALATCVSALDESNRPCHPIPSHFARPAAHRC